MESKDARFANGNVLLFNKPYGWTSFQLVNKVKHIIKKIYKEECKVGHAGTLDPLAKGLLIVCTGKATRMADSIQAQVKEYHAVIKLGESTPSYDLETPVLERKSAESITTDKINEVLRTFEGLQMQVPPIYSAVNINGKRAYEFARAGKDANINAKEIHLYKIELIEWNAPYLTIHVKCSKGTYVRALARDLAIALGTVGYLVALERWAIGEYFLKNAITIESFEENAKNIGSV